MEIIDVIKVTKFGDSLYARIPSRVARIMGVAKGTELQLSKEGSKIIYEPKHE